jgi:hypothetical protein
MRSLFHSVTRLLLLVMLATVFSPTFGWQAAQGMATHDEGTAMHAGHDAHAGHEGHAEQGHDICASDCAGHAQESCADARHHCCPGFILGHLLGGTVAHLMPVIPTGSLLVLHGRDARFSSRVPDGLERPPRASAA